MSFRRRVGEDRVGPYSDIARRALAARRCRMLRWTITPLALVIASCGERAATLPACQTIPSYQAAASELDTAETKIAEGDFTHADEGLKHAIDALGYQYSDHAPKALHDDTGLGLGVALDVERHGDLRHASQVRRQVLKERLETYKRWSCRA